ncbi:hypothetical protein HN51_023849 [Arachis hypogaea]|uniref:Uncharacterized protein n=1 Tax=Arachis hypogaea TaxID=3818 RepID=A0A445C3N8_ARAHY|nr:glutamic acid-rich protein [Arachis hypogaea]QHO26811.1 uncharacterized protein DS421_7g202730 [Arachis hypogaea]RYR45548.1 hypothetical protein Ahy_A07g031387 [Arachis hypogaea]
MPSATSRRKKPNKVKKNSTLTKTNHHSSPTVQPFQGSCDLKPLKEEEQAYLEPFVVVEHQSSYLNSTMEVYLNGDLKEEETHQNVEESLTKEEKEEVVVVSADDGGESDIKDEQEIVLKEENSEDVSDECFEHVVSSSPNDEFNGATKEAQFDDNNNGLTSETVELELELKEEQEEAFEYINDPSSFSENDDSREPEEEVVETVIKDVKVLEEKEENVMHSNVTEDVVSSEETDENDNKVSPPVPISTPTKQEDEEEEEEEEETAKGSDRSLVPPYESSKEESFQPLPNVLNAETTTVTVQREIQVPSNTQNQGIVSVAPRQHTSWSSCCGIFEVLRGGGDR